MTIVGEVKNMDGFFNKCIIVKGKSIINVKNISHIVKVSFGIEIFMDNSDSIFIPMSSKEDAEILLNRIQGSLLLPTKEIILINLWVSDEEKVDGKVSS